MPYPQQETLDAFQREWYRLSGEGKLSALDVDPVPDIYVRNQQLRNQLQALQAEAEQMQDVSTAAKSTWDRYRKERDFHRMHHKRVVQEKKRLVADLRRLKSHCDSYEPMLNMMRTKYETAMKEKMMLRLERDRLAAKVAAFEEQMKQLEAARASDTASPPAAATKRGARSSSRLPDSCINPYHSRPATEAPMERWGLSKTFQAHNAAISAIAVHPSRPVVATASDDCSWKMWGLPGGELLMSAEGHADWLSSIAFAPSGAQLATGSADCSVKIWDFATSRCMVSLSEHSQAVWGVAYHDVTDNFAVSCSMDHTAKVWDLVAAKCKHTLRGHVDSVNSVCFQPYSNNVCTGSGDKTVSLWDCRSGLCIQTFYGHKNSINSVSFRVTGDTIASGDADGVVRLWDVRMVAEKAAFTVGQYPCNATAFDPSGKWLAAGCDDGQVRVFDTELGELRTTMTGHSDAVQCCTFDRKGQWMVTGGSDATLRLWC